MPEIAEQVMKDAVQASGRRNFVWRCLFVLWPSARPMLTEMCRLLGDEVRMPGDDVSYLSQCIATGAETFHRYRQQQKQRYNTGEWDQNVFVMFFGGLFLGAAEAGCCQVTTENGNSWSVEGPQPYLEWRQENPGPVEILWRTGNSRITGEQLARRIIDACGGPRTWVMKVLLEALQSGV